MARQHLQAKENKSIGKIPFKAPAAKPREKEKKGNSDEIFGWVHFHCCAPTTSKRRREPRRHRHPPSMPKKLKLLRVALDKIRFPISGTWYVSEKINKFMASS